MSERVGDLKTCEYCGTFNHTYACFVHQLDATRAALQKAEERRDELRMAWQFEKARAQKAEEVLAVVNKHYQDCITSHQKRNAELEQTEAVARELLIALKEEHGIITEEIFDCSACNLVRRATALFGDPPKEGVTHE